MLNPEEILFCSKLCGDVYDIEVQGFVDVNDMRYGIRGLNDTIYVAFRGTANTINALRDVTIFPPALHNGYLTHRGFAQAAKKLIPLIPVENFEGLNVVFTGHSFGAIIAALFAHHYGKQAITFGCPAGHFWFAPTPNINHVRIVCDDDPVPKMPLLTGKHTCRPALVLKDDDFQLVSVKDHHIGEYNKRLQIWAEQQKEGKHAK